jgi:aminoglycoside phosphotransferase (APT) family kinase protein
VAYFTKSLQHELEVAEAGGGITAKDASALRDLWGVAAPASAAREPALLHGDVAVDNVRVTRRDGKRHPVSNASSSFSP